MIYKKIKKWASPYTFFHDRNIIIAYKYAKFGSRKVANEYNLSLYRISSIYRILMAHLWEQRSGVPWHVAVHDKSLYKSEDNLKMICDYYFSVFGKKIEAVIGE